MLYMYFYLISPFRHDVNSVVQRRDLKFEVIRQLAQGHICRKWQAGQRHIPLAPEPLPLTPRELNNGKKIPEAVVGEGKVVGGGTTGTGKMLGDVMRLGEEGSSRTVASCVQIGHELRWSWWEGQLT